MAEAAAGMFKKLVEGTEQAVKGLYGSESAAIWATLTPLNIDVPLAYHSLSISKGRAYLFGGRTLSKDSESVELSDNGMHIIILPSSGIESTDYKKIEASRDSPPRRYGHSSAVIETRIYITGGFGEKDELLNENGRVWVFDTLSNKWSHFDPSDQNEMPEARAYSAAVASEHPRPLAPKTNVDILPQDPPDAEVTMPEIPDTDTYGTLIIQGGTDRKGKHINDLWSFDISTRTWRELPSPPPPASTKPSLALVANRLYTFSVGQTSYLDLTRGFHDDRGGRGELGIAPAAPWQSIRPSSSSPDTPYPGERIGASMLPLTTGQGRNYLMLLGGESQGGDVEEDIWVLQLKPEGMTAASFMDAAKMAMKQDTNETQWSQVKYLNTEGVLIQEGQEGRGIGIRKGAAAAKIDVDESSVVVFGGIVDGRPRSDGLMIEIS